MDKPEHNLRRRLKLPASALLIGFAMGSMGYGAGTVSLKNAYTLRDGGSVRDFEVATSEVLYTAPSGQTELRTIPAQPSADAVRQHALSLNATTPGEAQLVLYPKGAPRDLVTARVVTRNVLVRAGNHADLEALRIASGADSHSRAVAAEGYHLFSTDGAGAALSVTDRLRKLPGVLSAEPVLASYYVTHLVPNDLFYTNQWHLDNVNNFSSNPVGTFGNDIRVTNVWDTYTGQGITFTVVDTGVQSGHPDLIGNMDVLRDFDYLNFDADASPVLIVPSDAHGTSVAGIIGAQGNNGIGVAGVAFDSEMMSVRLISGFGSFLSDFQIASALLHSNEIVHVSNNSWGPGSVGGFISGVPLLVNAPIGTLIDAALVEGTSNGRGGLGTIYVFAAGNDANLTDSVNYSELASSIQTIAVGAVNDNQTRSSYSEPGSALVISAPSGGDFFTGRTNAITTTDTLGDTGFNVQGAADLADTAYTSRFNGTSAAAPVVSGAIGLMLQANPNLGWRDVQEILMRSARFIDPGDSDWIVNGAGFFFNHQYGAGVVHTENAVNLALGWTNLTEQVALSARKDNLNLAVPDLNAAGLNIDFDILTEGVRVEHVVVTVDMNSTFFGGTDLEMTVTSPAGTESVLAEKHFGPLFGYSNWRFTTVHNWGEQAEGTWRFHIEDQGFGSANNILNSVRLDIYGSSTNALPEVLVDDVAVEEGDAGSTNAVVNVGLSEPSERTITVGFKTSPGTAAGGGVDYTDVAGSLTFAPGATNQTVSIPIVSDTQVELNEFFSLTLLNAVNAQIRSGDATIQILNDDGPTWGITDASVVEGDAGTTNLASLTLSLSEASTNSLSVSYFTVDGTASAFLDYVPDFQTVTFLPGQLSQVITVEVLGDDLVEQDEEFVVELFGATLSTIQDGQGRVTILDDEPRVVIGDQTLIEGSSGGPVNAQMSLALSRKAAAAVSVDYLTIDGTAKAGSDYTASSGTAVFSPGQTNQNISIPIIGDLLDEADEETFSVALSNVSTNALLGNSLATIVIQDDDLVPSVSIADVVVPEGTGVTNSADFIVTLDAPSGRVVVVDYKTSGGTASVNSDYSAASGRVFFPPGTTSRTVPIPVFGDSTSEGSETFVVNLSNPVNAAILDSQGQATIVDDDAQPQISIDDLSVNEGDVTASVGLTVRLSNPSGLEIKVDYATMDGSATAGGDYTAGTGTLTIPAGSTSATLTLEILGDTTVEDNETFLVDLSNAVNASISDAQATVALLNDDGPVISISDGTVTEGDSGTVSAQFTVTLSEASAALVEVDYSTTDGTATVADGDYDPISPAGTIKFSPGDTLASRTVTVFGDTQAEPDESFFVILSNPSGATIADSQGEITLLDDDTEADLQVTVNPVAAGLVLEGHDFTYRIAVANNGAFGATNVVVTNLLPSTATLVSVSSTATVTTSTNVDGSLRFDLPVLTNAGMAEMDVTVRPSAGATSLSTTAGASSDQPDPNPADNTATLDVVVSNPVVGVALDSVVLTSENLAINGAVDAGEQVTVSVGLLNTGNADSTNVVVTLQATGGVTLPGAAQSYGVLPAGGGAVSRPFTFTADSDASGTVTASFLVEDQTSGGVNPLGTIEVTFNLPAQQGFSALDPILIPVDQSSQQVGNANVFPSQIEVSGLAGVIDDISVTFHGLSHTFAADLDVLLVAPSGEAVVLISDAGGANVLTSVDLAFNDAGSALPRLAAIASGTYSPTDHQEQQADVYPGAPSGPYASGLSAFNGLDPNGTWSLYIVDDAEGDAGELQGGWSLNVSTVSPVGDSAALSISTVASANPILAGESTTFDVTIANRGPAAATSVMFTNTVPSGLTVTSVSPSQGTVGSQVSPVWVNLGTLAADASATVSVQVRADAVGSFTNLFSVAASEFDLYLPDNSVSLVTQVDRPLMMSVAPPADRDQGFKISLQGTGGMTYVIEVSSNLVDWTAISTNVTLDGLMDLIDEAAPGSEKRFYRAVER